jgi:hypothetical protein
VRLDGFGFGYGFSVGIKLFLDERCGKSRNVA